MQKKGFTLLETLISISLFAVVSVISGSILISVVNTEKRTDIRNTLYQDARIVMEQLANEINNSSIDYGEYYSINVIQGGFGSSHIPIYGQYSGVYASRFYNPGETGGGAQGENPEDLGVACSVYIDNPGDLKPPESCKIIYNFSRDYETGQNPHLGKIGYDIDDANAFCDNAAGISCNPATDYTKQESLYLISEDATKKTIIGRQLMEDGPVQSNYAIAKLEMDGIDTDQNGIIDFYTCAKNYDCSNYNENDFGSGKDYDTIEFPNFTDIEVENDLKYTNIKNLQTKYEIGPTSAFVPITQFRSTVTSLEFRINPIEDPYKAFAEANMRIHPTVTILLTMEPSKDERDRYPGTTTPKVTIQRTVSTGVHNSVEKYPPTNDLLWVNKLLN